MRKDEILLRMRLGATLTLAVNPWGGRIPAAILKHPSLKRDVHIAWWQIQRLIDAQLLALDGATVEKSTSLRLTRLGHRRAGADGAGGPA
ncbi:hypothetical protein ACKI2N_027620 [Cupriavidus sp. 30B13]|uniref:hypothetical protein n=1 Tax=Cupriavidus sp. 30B13 TaxID=3384241 RepID=UPI003B8FA1A7